MPAKIEMRRQHHQDADEANHHRRPAINAYAFLENNRRHRHRDQWRRERDGGCLDDRQASQRGEVEEHAADADHAAPEMAEWTAGSHRGGKLVAPSIDQHHRQDREGGAEKYDLSDRIALAEETHQCRHRGKQEGRYKV